ncbi:hypothetical protein RJD24_10720 [Bacillaceae bacterium IKA-2]|nr:hypothetical protein RJD24_10720 [Bacillaceae bacterium IKA-2]
MSDEAIYFTDNFFSAGITSIYNEKQEKISSLDLKSAFTSSVEIINLEGNTIVKGAFPFFSRRWKITDKNDDELGTLKHQFSFLTKNFEYSTHGRGVYQIKSEAFSREYQIFNDEEILVSEFKKITGFFESPIFQLTNQSEKLSYEELVAVVMGVNMITKRNRRAAPANS